MQLFTFVCGVMLVCADGVPGGTIERPLEEYIVEITKDANGTIDTRKFYRVMYVPLCGRPVAQPCLYCTFFM